MLHLLRYAHYKSAFCLFQIQSNKIKPQLHFPFGCNALVNDVCIWIFYSLTYTKSVFICYSDAISSLSLLCENVLNSQIGKWTKWRKIAERNQQHTDKTALTAVTAVCWCNQCYFLLRNMFKSTISFERCMRKESGEKIAWE